MLFLFIDDVLSCLHQGVSYLRYFPFNCLTRHEALTICTWFNSFSTSLSPQNKNCEFMTTVSLISMKWWGNLKQTKRIEITMTPHNFNINFNRVSLVQYQNWTLSSKQKIVIIVMIRFISWNENRNYCLKLLVTVNTSAKGSATRREISSSHWVRNEWKMMITY